MTIINTTTGLSWTIQEMPPVIMSKPLTCREPGQVIITSKIEVASYHRTPDGPVWIIETKRGNTFTIW